MKPMDRKTRIEDGVYAYRGWVIRREARTIGWQPQGRSRGWWTPWRAWQRTEGTVRTLPVEMSLRNACLAVDASIANAPYFVRC
jgi:hypothetical protein